MRLILYLLIAIFILGCHSENKYDSVGDIPYDPQIDNASFEICDEKNIKQYYVRRSSDIPPSYEGEKIGLENSIRSQYSFPISKNKNGYITIRFIVNCKGKTGRFRIEQMDFNYKPTQFDQSLIDQLLNIIKQLDGWIPRRNGDINFDFYQYLTLKIEDGQIINILP